MFYAALDVSLRSVAVCIIDDDGKVRLERSVPSDGRNGRPLFRSRPRESNPGAGRNGPPLQRALIRRLRAMTGHCRPFRKATFSPRFEKCT